MKFDQLNKISNDEMSLVYHALVWAVRHDCPNGPWAMAAFAKLVGKETYKDPSTYFGILLAEND